MKRLIVRGLAFAAIGFGGVLLFRIVVTAIIVASGGKPLGPVPQPHPYFPQFEPPTVPSAPQRSDR